MPPPTHWGGAPTAPAAMPSFGPAASSPVVPTHGGPPGSPYITTDQLWSLLQHRQAPDVTRGLPTFSGKEDDFPLWRRRFESAMYEKGIDLSVPHSAQRHTTSIKHALLTHLDDVNIAYLDRCNNDGITMWITLVNRYSSADPTVVQGLRDRLQTLMLARDANKYIAEVSSLVAQLRQRDVVVTEADHIQYLVNGLTPAYASVRDTLLDPRAARDLHTVEEHIRNVHRSLRHTRGTVNMTKKSRSSKPCPRCHKPGHWVTECPLPCSKCKLTGHSESRCPKSRSTNGALGNQKARENRRPGRTNRPSNVKRSATARSDLNAVSAIAASNKHVWLLDSGSDFSLTPFLDIIEDYEEASDEKVTVANGAPMCVKGSGFITLRQDGNHFRIPVRYAPDVSQNILSTRDMNAHGFTQRSTPDNFSTLENGSLVFRAPDFRLCCEPAPQALAVIAPGEVWHARLGHADHRMLHRLRDHSIGLPSGSLQVTNCTPCIVSKMKRANAKRALNKGTSFVGELVHTDGAKFPCPDVSGNEYAQFFVDDYSRYVFVFLMKRKVEAFQGLLEFLKIVPSIKAVRSDGAGELRDSKFKHVCAINGIRQQFSDPYSPEMNSRAEAKIRDLTVMCRTLLLAMNLPPAMWGYAILAAGHIKNRVLTKALDVVTTPYEQVFGIVPNLGHIRIFGCVAYPYRDRRTRDKLDSTASPCVFVGYTGNDFQYVLYCPVANRSFISRSVVFLEDKPGGELLRDTHPLRVKEAAMRSRVQRKLQTYRSSAALDPSSRLIPMDLFTEESTPHNAVATITVSSDPKTYAEAMRQNREGWTRAIEEELASLHKLDVFEVIPAAAAQNLVTSKWVFKTKMDARGRPTRLKARLVARGFSQRPNIDFFATFAPTAAITTFRILISISVSIGLKIFHLDVKSAFLNSELEEEVTMLPPPGVDIPAGCALRLKRSIYGLKQAGRNWFLELQETLLQCGFNQSTVEPCLFVSLEGSRLFNGVVYVLVYVDDIILCCERNEDHEKLSDHLRSKYKLGQDEPLQDYLGMDVNRTSQKIYLSQPGLIQELLRDTGMADCRAISTPAEVGRLQHGDNSDSPTDQRLYRTIVGVIGHLARHTRPDIAYAFRQLAQYQQNPDASHMRAARRVVRYLSSFTDLGLEFTACDMILHSFVDSDFAGDLDDRKSVTGYCFMLGDNVVSWRSTKQTMVALSSAESEYIALSECAKELAQLRTVLGDLGYPQDSATVVKTDSQSSMAIATGDSIARRSKHIDVKYHHVRDLVAGNVISLSYVPSKDNIADVLTKPLPREPFRSCVQHYVVKVPSYFNTSMCDEACLVEEECESECSAE